MRILGELGDKCFLPRVIDIRFVDDHDAVKIIQEQFDIVAVDAVTSRIIRGAEKYHLGKGVDDCFDGAATADDR